MKTRATSIFMTLALALVVHFSYGQESLIYEMYDGRSNQDISALPKMDRDIYILQNILNDLFTGDRNSYSTSRRSKGMYVPNNGVIFDISGNSTYGARGYQSWNDLVVLTTDGDAQMLSKNFSEEELEKFNAEKESKLEELSKTFLSNYGSLLGELKDNEKIQLSVNYSLHVKSSSRKIDGQFAFVSSSKDVNKRRLVSVISAKDVKAFEAGKISQDDLTSRIKTTSHSINDDDMVDAKILAGIFDDLFRRTYDGYLGRSGRTSWTYFEGFGLMYNVNLSSRSNNFSLRTTDEGEVVVSNNKTVKSEDFYKEIQDKYPEFESLVKENIVKYGRTLRSLQSNEVVIVNIGVSANKRSNLPRTIQFMIPKSSIEAYAKGQKSLDQVKQEINIKKLSASVHGNNFPVYSPVQGATVISTSDIEAQAVQRAQSVRGSGKR